MASDPTVQAGPTVPGRCRFGDIVVDAAARTLTRGGQEQALEPKAFSVLLALLSRPGELVTRDELLDAVWGHRHVTPGVLTRAIAQLRTALADDPHEPRYIQTRHALGYVLIARPEPPVTRAVEPSVAPVPDRADGPAPVAAPGDRRQPGRDRRHPPGRQRAALGLLLVALLGWLAWSLREPAAPGPGEASLAVLPFMALSEAPEDQHFAQGLSLEMLGALAGVHGLQVAAWRPPEAIDRRLDVRELGRQLGVATVLDASVRRGQGRVRIVATLSDVRTGYTLWTRRFDRVDNAVFDTQGEIANEVAHALVGALPDAGEDLRRRLAPTRDLQAFEAYLRGLVELRKPGARERAVAHFREALAHDANFARAQAGICRAEAWRFEGHRAAEAFDNARLACLRAANMDPTIGGVQLALGDLYRVREQFDQALDHYGQAAADLSVRPMALAGRAKIAAAQGRMADALQGFREALALAPADAGLHADLAYQLYLAGDLPAAIGAMQRASELRPGDAYVWSTYGSMLMAAGRNDEAIAAFERSRAIEPIEAVISNLGTLRFQAGDHREAAARYREAIALNPGNPFLWGNLGDALAAMPATAADARTAYAEAAQRAQAYVDLNPGDAKALALLGWYRAKLGESGAARELARRAEAVGREPAEVALANAHTFAALGDLDGARARLEAARAAGMTDVRIASSVVLRGAGLLPSPPAPPPGDADTARATPAPQTGD